MIRHLRFFLQILGYFTSFIGSDESNTQTDRELKTYDYIFLNYLAFFESHNNFPGIFPFS